MRIRALSAALFLVFSLLMNVAAFGQTRTAPGTSSEALVPSFGVEIIVNPGAGVNVLTRAQVAGIFTGSIKNWSQVGGRDLPVVAIARGQDSLPQTNFERVYTNGATPAGGRTAVSLQEAVDAVASTSGAVSFISNAETQSVDTVTIVNVSDVRNTDVTGLIDLSTVKQTTAAGAYQVIGAIGSHTAPIAALAPTQMNTDSLETHSLITRDFIEENSSPLAEFTRIATIAPSVTNTGAVNGPGLSEQTLVIRGMAKDFTNLTFDGIPEADTNDPSYHSTSFFPELMVGGVDVVRGPGLASDFGYATFGGSENVFSLAPSEHQALTLAYSTGTWATNIGSVTYQSGRQKWLGNGNLILTYQDLGSNGYLTGNAIWSRNYSFKYEVPVGHNTLIDLFGTWNDQSFNAADAGPGATLYELTNFGANYSLNNNPASGECTCYNFQIKTTDLGYLRVRSDLGGNWHLDNKLYTYRYDNETTAADTVGLTSTMAAAGAFPSQGTITCAASFAACTAPLVPGTLAANGLQFNPTDVGGYLKRNKYIATGDIFLLTKNFNSSDFIRGGVWLEHSDTDRHQYSVDFSNNSTWNYVNGTNCLFGGPLYTGAAQISGANPTVIAANCSAAAANLPAGLKQLPGQSYGVLSNGTPIGAVKFDQQSQILNAQPMIEGQIVLPSGTTIYAGGKMVNIQRYVTAQIQNTSRTPNLNFKPLYQQVLPYASLNQTIVANPASNTYTSFYFQYGVGYEIPDLATTYVSNPGLNATTPNESQTYQGGFIGKSNSFVWDVDYYTINFSNLQTSLSVDAAGNICAAAAAGCSYSAFFDVGGARYRGVEFEGTLNLTGGLALYANYSSDLAQELTYNSQVKGVPLWTSALGLLYKSPRFDSSLIYKMVGNSYLNAYTGPASAANYNDPNQQVFPYGLLDLDLTWKVGTTLLQFNVYNLTNAQPWTNSYPTALTSSSLVNHIAPTSFLLTLKQRIF